MHRIHVTPFSKPGWHIFKSATCPWRSWVLSLTEARRHHGTRPWNCLVVKLLQRVIQWSGRQEHDAEHDAAIHDTITSNLRYLNSFVRALLWCIDIMSFLVFKLHCYCLVAPHRDQPSGTPAVFDSWATSLFVWLQKDRAGEAERCKGNIFIREYNPETMKIVWVPTATES